MSQIKHSYNRILEISDDHKQVTLPDARYYRRNSQYYPSVTYVLGYYPKGKFFEDWLKKVGYASEYIVKKAAEEGTLVHGMIEEYLNNKYEDYITALDIYENSKSLKLSRIIIDPKLRNSGVGTNIMLDLIKYADNNKKIITLTPSSDFGGNKNKLVQFYKRFGFKLNKGIYKNYEYMDTMIRYPKINQMSETKLFIKELVKEYLNKQK